MMYLELWRVDLTMNILHISQWSFGRAAKSQWQWLRKLVVNCCTSALSVFPVWNWSILRHLKPVLTSVVHV